MDIELLKKWIDEDYSVNLKMDIDLLQNWIDEDYSVVHILHSRLTLSPTIHPQKIEIINISGIIDDDIVCGIICDLKKRTAILSKSDFYNWLRNNKLSKLGI